jgi:CcmD family protein
MDMEKWQNLGYLFWAYTFFWALVAGYLVLITRRMARLKREIELLRRERKDGAAG